MDKKKVLSVGILAAAFSAGVASTNLTKQDIENKVLGKKRYVAYDPSTFGQKGFSKIHGFSSIQKSDVGSIEVFMATEKQLEKIKKHVPKGVKIVEDRVYKIERND